MRVLKAVKERRSIREFLPKKVPSPLVSALTEALIWAPSAGNLQARRFYFVFNRKMRQRLAAAALNQAFIAEAPLAIIACTDSTIGSRYGARGVGLYSVQDVSASLMGMMLVAHEEGLGTVWVGSFDEETVSEILHLPGTLRPVAIVPVGFPRHVPAAPARVSIDEAVVMVR